MILGISTSLSQFCVSLNHNDQVIYQHQTTRESEGKSSMFELISGAFEQAGTGTSALSGIVVDIGPGGTSSVRTGVSFANGLSYSLNIPIAGVSSVELMGREAYKTYNRPVAVLLKSIKNNFYCGFYDGKSLYLKYAGMEQIGEYIMEKYPEIALAGSQNGMFSLSSRLQGVQVAMSAIHNVSSQTLGETSALLVNKLKKYPFLPSPITETNLNTWSPDL